MASWRPIDGMFTDARPVALVRWRWCCPAYAQMRDQCCALQVQPNKLLGVIGEHDGYPVEDIDVSHDLTYLWSPLLRCPVHVSPVCLHPCIHAMYMYIACVCKCVLMCVDVYG